MSTRSRVDRQRRTRWGRLAITLVVLASTAITAQYASADFADPTAVAQGATTAARLSLTLGEDATQLFETTLTPFYPGATYQRTIDITIGASTLKTLSVTPSDNCGGCASSLLTSDATNGLTMGIERCTTAWTPSGTPPTRTYTCGDAGGGTNGGTQILAATAFASVRNGSMSLSTGLSSLTANATYYYIFFWQMPSGTSSATQGLSATLAYYFTGTQRDATAK